MSSLSHSMNVRRGIAPFSIGTISHSGVSVITNPPTCCDRCRGKPRICRTSFTSIRTVRSDGSSPAPRSARIAEGSAGSFRSAVAREPDPTRHDGSSRSCRAHDASSPAPTLAVDSSAAETSAAPPPAAVCPAQLSPPCPAHTSNQSTPFASASRLSSDSPSALPTSRIAERGR